MTSTNFYWITGFLFLLLSLHLLYPLIFKYIDNKPNGVQSIFDLVIRDHFMIGRFNGTVYCVIAIISRIDPIAEVLIQYKILAIIMSSVYDFSFAFGCINTGVNFIYILCAHFIFCTKVHRKSNSKQREDFSMKNERVKC